MPDTRKGHNPSGAPDPTRARAENNMKITSRRMRNGCMILFMFCGMWQMPQGLRLQSALS